MNTYDIADISTKFNKVIKKLINIMDSSIHNNILFDTIKRKIKIAIDSNPLLLLEEGGIYIFKYRDYIANDQFDELFLNTEQLIDKTEQEVIDKYTKNNSDDSNKNIEMLINILRDLWKGYTNDEKKIIKKNIKTLLSEYCKYISIVKN